MPILAVHEIGIILLLNVIFIFYIFRWKKWAFVAHSLTVLIASVIAFIYVKELYLVGVFSQVILYLLLRPKWSWLE